MWEYLSKKLRVSRPAKEHTDLHATHNVDTSSGSKAVKKDESRPASSRRAPIQAGSKGSVALRRLKCPVCAGSEMIRVFIGGVEVDECPQCGGIFLDRGELKAIIGREPSSYEKSDSGRKSSDDEFTIYTPHGLSDHIRNRE